MRLTAIAALCLFTLPAMAQDMVTVTPEQIGQIFCIGRLGNDEAPIRSVLTPELSAAVAAAEAESADWETKNPGEKPPLGDGVPWQGWPDYAPQCVVGTVTPKDDATIEVELKYSFPDNAAANWTDILVLKTVEQQPRIDNILYSPDGNLRDALASVFNY
jgi:hypothetical protein